MGQGLEGAGRAGRGGHGLSGETCEHLGEVQPQPGLIMVCLHGADFLPTSLQQDPRLRFPVTDKKSG